MTPGVARLAARYPVPLTGAWVSTESGIPDLRTRRPRWTARDAVATGNSGARYPVIRDAAHHAIVELTRPGRLVCGIAQNVDDLHSSLARGS
jgi:NAD-dependent SIR2 family protein deacetylase